MTERESPPVSPLHTVVHDPLEPPLGDDARASIAGGFDPRYERRALLGVGGMGEVHLCADRVIGREVAMKRIRGEARGSATTYARFVREALVQARLEHPAVVPVYDVSLQPDGSAWFTMKRIRGRTLERIFAALRADDPETTVEFSRRKLLSAFVQLCLAVDYAHEHGVIHRDLKPGNVMLGDYGEIHVLDWGLAKVAGEAEPQTTLADLASVEAHDTIAGAAMGTPGYMSPEQVRGEHATLDARTDVFALGAILFEIVTLERLIQGTDVPEIFAATLRGPDAHPSARGKEAPPELEAACVRATALDRERRHASARELASDVERYLDGDRDVERRRELALQHVAAAEQHADRGAASHADALRELGRAVALDPTNDRALGLLARRIMEPPAQVSPEAHGELERMRNEGRRSAARTAALRFTVWAMFLPLVYWMGIRDWPLTLSLSGIIALAAVASAVASRRATHDVRVGLVLLGASSIVIALSSALFGPFMMVPGLAATNAMYFAMSSERRHRFLAPLLSTLVVATPFALEALGVISPSYSFDGEFTIHERAAHFPATATVVTLLLTSLGTIAIPASLVGRMRDALNRAEERVFFQAWHLRQMLPESARQRVGLETAA